MGKINIFGKTIPISVVAILLLASIGLAALMPNFGDVSGTVSVSDAISLTGTDGTGYVIDVEDEGAVAGNSYITGVYTVTNNAQTPIDIAIAYGVEGDCDGIVTEAHENLRVIMLENKDSSWATLNGDDRFAMLTYYVMKDEFNYSVSAFGLDANTDYSIIYYADKPDRFADWGGDNPGALIGTFTTDGTGDATDTGSTELDMNLPSSPDANIDENIYCIGEPDAYAVCYGAKIWIVPSSDYAKPALTAWNPTDYLFETDLMHYYDTNDTTQGIIGADEMEMEITGMTVNPGEDYARDFVIVSHFDPLANLDECNVTVELIPAL